MLLVRHPVDELRKVRPERRIVELQDHRHHRANGLVLELAQLSVLARAGERTHVQRIEQEAEQSAGHFDHLRLGLAVDGNGKQLEELMQRLRCQHCFAPTPTLTG